MVESADRDAHLELAEALREKTLREPIERLVRIPEQALVGGDAVTPSAAEPLRDRHAAAARHAFDERVLDRRGRDMRRVGTTLFHRVADLFGCGIPWQATAKTDDRGIHLQFRQMRQIGDVRADLTDAAETIRAFDRKITRRERGHRAGHSGMQLQVLRIMQVGSIKPDGRAHDCVLSPV